MEMFYVYIVLFGYITASSIAANILCFFSFPSISHQVVFQPIWRELSLRGHNVTVLTPNPLNDTSLINLTEIDLSSSYQLINLQKQMPYNLPVYQATQSAFELILQTIDYQLNLSHVRNLINNPDAHFDLVMVEPFSFGAFAFAAHFNSPLIGVASLDVFPNTLNILGNPIHPVLYPHIFSPKIYEYMDLWDRIKIVFYNIWFKLWQDYIYIPRTEREIIRKYFPNITSVKEIEKYISMLFVNLNPVVHGIRPNVPNVINMGMMHLKPLKPLPEDLQSYLDKATNGVIYISFGSNIKSSNLPPQILNRLVAAVDGLPYDILWKWESDYLPNKPKNVHLHHWLPQRDVLAHPNIKVFITQGGLQSLEETIINEVPIVGIPFIADQWMNVQRIEYLGAGKWLDPQYFTVDNLRNTIIEVASNDKYRLKMKELKEILIDQPNTGLERAIWWTEYVLRHRGSRHLQSSYGNIPLYKYLLLDVLVAFAIILWILYKISILSFIYLLNKKYFTKKIKTN